MNDFFDRYRTMTVPALQADPLFMEWVFFPQCDNNRDFRKLALDDERTRAVFREAGDGLLRFSTTCPVIGKAQEHYKKMKAELSSVIDAESGFSIAMNYISSMLAEIKTYEFPATNREVHFFKVIKPLFCCEREFFTLRHHAELFCDDDSRFWSRQQARMKRFTGENEYFLERYITGDPAHDVQWFTRSSFRDRVEHDQTVSTYLGMEKYLRYIELKMQRGK